MPVSLTYAHHPRTGVPDRLTAEAIWAVAAQLRRAVARQDSAWALQAGALAAAATVLEVNRRRITAAWDFAHAVHDEDGRAVLGICETDPAAPGLALVSVNAGMVTNRPELALSTAAHEIGHIVFDVPAAVDGPARRYRSVTVDPGCLDRATLLSERRANEFMGALLAPAAPLHLRLVAHARAEGLRMVHAPHRGRPGSRVLARETPPDALAGIVAALAGDFGVSDRFIAVRIRRYGLIEGAAL
ncbi:hypothetical protein [Belnapia rosea]|uniref:IrrE N-terminal-like domain-containing protein n=1 Tax=Belnapia rosea TaxID=938405 RepID=A0A1G6RP33_9PROT|nr:hypothetical protein [Belnapia rosea]SDD06399.1 hypothetical protein SAMN04487779_100484 [Belnapia rosea]